MTLCSAITSILSKEVSCLDFGVVKAAVVEAILVETVFLPGLCGRGKVTVLFMATSLMKGEIGSVTDQTSPVTITTGIPLDKALSGK